MIATRIFVAIIGALVARGTFEMFCLGLLSRVQRIRMLHQPIRWGLCSWAFIALGGLAGWEISGVIVGSLNQ